MRAAKFARDSWPEQKPGEVLKADAGYRPPDRPRSWEELDCPDEITLELPDGVEWRYETLHRVMRRAGLSTDQAVCWQRALPSDDATLVVTKQAEDCWYAGVPRGRRLVLRRI